MLPNFKI